MRPSFDLLAIGDDRWQAWRAIGRSAWCAG